MRSLRFQDETGQWHRYRVCTIWNLENDRFTRRPAKARLVKEKTGGRIGVLIMGSGAGFVKIGRSRAVQQNVITSLDAISKKPRGKLLRQIGGEITEDDGVIVAWEG